MMTTMMTTLAATRRRFMAGGALLALPLLSASTASPEGRWAGVTAMAHGALPLHFDLTSDANGWQGRAILGQTDLDGAGVTVDSLRVAGDSLRFAFALESPMGRAHIHVEGATRGDSAAGTISLSSQGVVLDQGTWTAERGGG